ncbi:MAG: hypothetical protein C3F11_16040 [Methylocystaceae bacterium]|nr:MAG: hypothetical protein C3F11_16040 [Methylocystaceae bacterium]
MVDGVDGLNEAGFDLSPSLAVGVFQPDVQTRRSERPPVRRGPVLYERRPSGPPGSTFTPP